MSPRNIVPAFSFDNGIRIVPFELNHQEQVVNLFQKGLRSYATEENEKRGRGLLTEWFLQDKLKKDMKDIYASYMDGSKNEDLVDFEGLCFFAALDADDSVMGCVGVVAPTDEEAAKYNVDRTEMCELIRMSVREDCRGLGLGRKLVNAVEEFAKSNGYKSVGLSTLDAMGPAMALYKSCGYTVIKEHPIDIEKFAGPGDYIPINAVHFYKEV